MKTDQTPSTIYYFAIDTLHPRMKNRDVNGLIQAINNLPKDDPLEFIFIGDDAYLNDLAIDSALANQRWQPVLRINFGLNVPPR